ncbi:hydrogenase iron-sulfur subunit, partial [Methanobrevibacter sp.]
TAADNIGINRLSYPESIHIIKVISVNRVMPKHIIHALKTGADGIFIGEYPGDLLYDEIEHNMKKIRREIEMNNMNPERLAFSKVYIPYFSGLARKFIEFDSKIEEINDLAKLS